MLSLSKKAAVANIVIEDYAIRIAIDKGNGIRSLKEIIERPIEEGLLENGKIVDEIRFFDFIKTLAQELNLKQHEVRFYVPNSLVIMRHVEIPEHVKDQQVKEYFVSQIGKTLHLPFENPLLDVFVAPHEQLDEQVLKEKEDYEELAATKEESAPTKKGVIFAAPEEEVIKYIDLFEDAKMIPTVIDVQALGVYRYFQKVHNVDPNQSYLFFEMNLTTSNLSIFHDHKLEFLRFQQLDLTPSNWKSDTKYSQFLNWTYEDEESERILTVVSEQIEELERIMNFFRYSQNSGERTVNEIIIFGDFPNLESIVEEVESRYQLPVTLLKGKLLDASEGEQKEFDSALVSVLGLALKGE